MRPTPTPLPAADPKGTTLVGREPPLRELRDAFEETLSGRSITVRVGGAPGMGKSALVQHFLDELVGGNEAVVLRGRAYERETVPYKAIDSAVDALSRYLMRLADLGETFGLPDDVGALARLFPVLRRVPSIAVVAEESLADPQGVRMRAFAAMRELLASLVKQRPLVLFVDDAHWGDTDSAALLLELMRPPDAPPLLLVMTYRDGEAQTSPFLIEMAARWPELAEERDLTVGPLELKDAQRLALTLLGSDDEEAQRMADAAARESGGSPFLVEELARSASGTHSARHRAATPADETSGSVAAGTLERMVSERLARLPDDARRLIEIIAVGGRPLAVSLVADASGIHEEMDEVLAVLRSRRFVEAGVRDGREVVETCNDRIRETIVGQLSAATVRDYHGQLARVLEAMPEADSEALAVHLLGSGEKARASVHAERAAAQAVSKLAFEQAVRLYKLALETSSAAPADARPLRTQLAKALELAGRGMEAVTAYRQAAAGAPPSERVELEQAAAEQLLTSGHMEEGVTALGRILEAVGLRLPTSRLDALISLVLFRLWMRIRGLRFTERRLDAIRREDRLRVDALHGVVLGLNLVNTLYGISMQARHLMHALRSGDSFQVLRAAGIEAANCAATSGTQSKRERTLMDLVQGLTDRGADHEGRAVVHRTRGIQFFLRGHWKEARDALDMAFASLSKHGSERASWHSNTHLFRIWTLAFLGKMGELAKRLPALLADADRRGDLYTSVNLRIGYTNLMWLAADDVASARRHVKEAMAVWSHETFSIQHYRAMLAGANIDLYVGDGASAYDGVERVWKKLQATMLLRVQYMRADANFLRARCAIASLGEGAHRRARLVEIRELAKRLERERMPWIAPLAAIISAAASEAEGDRSAAATSLRAAIDLANAADMSLHAAAARHQLGSMLGGEEGGALVREACQAMTAQGVRTPAGFASMLVPGSWAAC